MPEAPILSETALPSGRSVTVARVPGGAFWMGSDRGETEEQPRRVVTVSNFDIDQFEVTVAQYRDCVAAGRCAPPARGEDCNWDASNREDHPINCVSWYDARQFCAWAGKRLPTEAEWEKAARGVDGRIFPWGIEAPDCSRAVTAWGSLGCGGQGTAPVGSTPAGVSPYGAMDMIGNVWEWVADAYAVDYYRHAPIFDPVNTAPSAYRVLRGNSWYYSYPTMVSRASNRYRFKPARWYPYIGFRCVLSDQAIPEALGDAAAEAAFAEPDWIVRNLSAREMEGEPPFDGTPRSNKMIEIPAGTFIMGSARGESDEAPVRSVFLDAFSIDRYEVTVAQYRRCVATGGCEAPEPLQGVLHSYERDLCNWGRTDRENHPINCMRWREADQYCRWAGKRLPTEAEWEKAARGVDGRRFPWGDAQANCDRAVIDDGGDGCGRESTWPVGSKPRGASPYGAMDMAGNVWEWVADGYRHDYYASAPSANPFNDNPTPSMPGGKPGNVLRGGSWADQTEIIHRAANRLEYDPDTPPDYTIGFRCARDVN